MREWDGGGQEAGTKVKIENQKEKHGKERKERKKEKKKRKPEPSIETTPT